MYRTEKEDAKATPSPPFPPPPHLTADLERQNHLSDNSVEPKKSLTKKKSLQWFVVIILLLVLLGVGLGFSFFIGSSRLKLKRAKRLQQREFIEKLITHTTPSPPIIAENKSPLTKRIAQEEYDTPLSRVMPPEEDQTKGQIPAVTVVKERDALLPPATSGQSPVHYHGTVAVTTTAPFTTITVQEIKEPVKSSKRDTTDAIIDSIDLTTHLLDNPCHTPILSPYHHHHHIPAVEIVHAGKEIGKGVTTGVSKIIEHLSSISLPKPNLGNFHIDGSVVRAVGEGIVTGAGKAIEFLSSPGAIEVLAVAGKVVGYVGYGLWGILQVFFEMIFRI